MECANCQRPATLVCGGCRGSPVLEGDAPFVHYCNAACQRANWAEHKPKCQDLKDRMSLYRVAEIPRKLFLLHRELNWTQFDVHRVEKSGENLFLRGEIKELGAWPKDYKVFPSHMFSTQADRNAALTLMGCIDAWQFMNEFVAGMLKGLVNKCEHIVFKTTNDNRRVRCYPLLFPQEDIDLDTGGIAHEVLKLTLRSGEEFVVDLACAQYVYSEPVMRWKEYKKLRILFEYLESGISAPKALGKLNVDDCSLERMVFFLDKLRKGKKVIESQAMNYLEAINFSMLEWQADEDLSIRALLKLPEPQFLRKKDDMVNYLDWRLDNPEQKYFTVSGRRLKEQRPQSWIFRQ